jgi:hypothetical protein
MSHTPATSKDFQFLLHETTMWPVWSPSQVSISSSIQWCHLANIYGSKYMVLQVHKLASKILRRQNKDVYNSVSNYLIIPYHCTQDTYSNIIVARFSTLIQASRITSSGHAMGPRILGRSRSSSLLLCWMRSELLHTIICHLRQNVLELSARGPREVQEYLFFNVGSLVVLGWCPPLPIHSLLQKRTIFCAKFCIFLWEACSLILSVAWTTPSRSEPESAMSSSYIAAEEIQ